MCERPINFLCVHVLKYTRVAIQYLYQCYCNILMLHAFRPWRLTNILSSSYDVILYRVVVVACVCVGGQAGSHWVWDKLFLISPAWPAALNNNNNIAFSQHWQRLTVACAAEPSAAPQNTPSETESSWESNTKEQKQKQNPLDSTKTEPPSLQEQSGWSANNKAVANCAFRCSFCFICRSRWQPALTSAFHPLVIYLLESPAVNRGWGHATVAHLLKKAELLTALWASSVPRCRPSLLAKVFHYEPFCPWASGAAHYDNHSGRVGYAPCLLYIVLLWWDTVACAGQGERRCSRGGGVGVWGGGRLQQ